MKIVIEIDEPREKLIAPNVEGQIRRIMTDAASFTSRLSKANLKCRLLIETSQGRIDYYSQAYELENSEKITPRGNLTESKLVSELSLSGRTFCAFSKVRKDR